MQKITPCLWFDTQAEEAARFYTSVFKNSKINTVTRYPEGSSDRTGQVLTVAFELDGQEYIALNGGPEFRFSEAISLSVDCATQEEVDTLWDKLIADGGEESMCGWLNDKYGLSWQIVPRRLVELLNDADDERKMRVTQAMLKMRKIEVDKLEAA